MLLLDFGGQLLPLTSPWLRACLPQTNHPKSTQNSEKSSYYQCVCTEELLWSFPLATTHFKVVNSGSSKVVIARYCIRYFFKKERRYRFRSWKIMKRLACALKAESLWEVSGSKQTWRKDETRLLFTLVYSLHTKVAFSCVGDVMHIFAPATHEPFRPHLTVVAEIAEVAKRSKAFRARARGSCWQTRSNAEKIK